MQLIFLQYEQQIKQRLMNTSIRASAERLIQGSGDCDVATVRCHECPLYVMNQYDTQICFCIYRRSTDLVRRMLAVHA